MDFLRQHSLSLSLLVIMAISLVMSLVTGATGSDIWANVFGDTWGAWLIVVFTKFFQERGKRPSKESN